MFNFSGWLDNWDWLIAFGNKPPRWLERAGRVALVLGAATTAVILGLHLEDGGSSWVWFGAGALALVVLDPDHLSEVKLRPVWLGSVALIAGAVTLTGHAAAMKGSPILAMLGVVLGMAPLLARAWSAMIFTLEIGASLERERATAVAALEPTSPHWLVQVDGAKYFRITRGGRTEVELSSAARGRLRLRRASFLVLHDVVVGQSDALEGGGYRERPEPIPLAVSMSEGDACVRDPREEMASVWGSELRAGVAALTALHGLIVGFAWWVGKAL